MVSNKPAVWCMAFATAWGTWACGGGKSEQKGPPKGSVVAHAARVDMKEARFASSRAMVVLVVDNASNQAVTVKSASISARYAGALTPGTVAADDNPQEVGEPITGSTVPSGKAVVAPGGSAEIPVELTLTYPTESDAFVAFVKTGAQKLVVTGTVKTTTGDLDVQTVTDFATPRLLEGQIKEPQVASMDDGASGEVVMDLILHNPNPFPVKAGAWEATFTVADKMLKKDEYARGETVLPGSGVRYSETFKVDAENWGPDFKAVLKKPKIPYVVEGTITAEGITYPVKAEGAMQFHR